MKIKNIYLLFFLIAALASSVYFEFTLFHASDARKIESLQKKINFVEQKSTIICDNIIQQYQKDSSVKSFTGKDFAYAIYENDSLINWSNPNKILLNNISSIKQNYDVRFFNNTYFLVYKKSIANKTFAIFYPIYNHFNFPNKYIKNGWLNFPMLTSLEIVEQPAKSTTAIQSIEKNTLFFVRKTTAVNALAIPIQFLFIAFYLLFFAGLIFLFFKFFKEKSFLISSYLAIFFCAAVYCIVHYFKYPFSLYQFGVFNPEIYASKFFDSLGALTVIALLWFFVCTWITKKCKRNNSFSHAVFATFTGIHFAFSVYTVSSLINDSSINFSVFNYAEINIFSLLGLLIIAINLVNFFLLVYRWNKHFATITHFLKAIIFFFFALMLLALANQYLEWNIVLSSIQWIVAGVFFVGFYYLLNRILKHNFLFPIALFLATTVLFTAYLCNECIQKKEINNQISLANYLSKERDEATEFSFEDVYQKLQHDKFVISYFGKHEFYKHELLNYLKEKYFDGYFSKYDVKIAVYLGNNNFYVGDKKLKDSIAINADTVSAGLFYLPIAQSESKYLGKILFQENGKTIGKIIVAFNTRAYKKETVYPSLVLNLKSNNEAAAEQTDYAIYSKNILKKQSGNFPFPLQLSNEIIENKNTILEINKNGFSQLLFQSNNGNTVWLSTSDLNAFRFLSLFCFLLIVSAIILIVRFSMYHPQEFVFFNRMSFRNKLLSIVAGLITFTLFSTIFLYIFYSKKELNNLLHLNLTNKIDNVQKDFLLSLETSPSKKVFHQFNSNTIEDVIQHLSTVHDIDINLFDAQGNLISSSQNLIFDNGIVAPKLRFDVLSAIIKQNSSLLFKDEQIGNLHFLSAYIPIVDAKNNVRYILNVPYFFRERDLINNFNNLLISLIIVFVLLILFAVLISYLISNNLTASFEVIRNKMSEIKLGKQNEPIEWNRNDEIGTLVSEYNKMIFQLQTSAEKLAQSERESAWREMAKQVAHEIKNPLTPMKLSIQMLERAIKDKRDDVNEMSLKVSKTLVEQIDNLAQIATQFSQFAKISSGDVEQFNVIELLQNSTSLFSQQNPSVKIVLKNDDTEVLVNADKNQLLSVFNNLVLNAVQAIPEENNGEIIVSEKCESDKVIIKVIDNGSGIEEDKLEKIFHPNFTTKSSGTGLGLAIAKTIIQAAGGEIKVHSKLSEGSIFEISLPKI